ncbi:hypothetical protein [Mucilaginibacter gossypii]|nr:hypothetical protein [Mucilaginibacter gossypii]
MKIKIILLLIISLAISGSWLIKQRPAPAVKAATVCSSSSK